MNCLRFHDVEIFISCKKLKDEDFISKSDPQVKVFELDAKGDKYRFVGETEVISNQHNPHFSRSIRSFYVTGKKQILKFEVFDEDIGEDDDLGYAKIDLHKLIDAGVKGVTKKLKNTSKGLM